MADRTEQPPQPPPEQETAPLFRLAFRNEGDFVNCYLAPPAGVDEAPILLGSMRRTLCNKGFWEPWKALMVNVGHAALQATFPELAAQAKWIEAPAPESERSKQAKPA